MANEQDCLAVYDQLLDLLNELGLAWIVDQVIDVVSTGKTVEEIVSGRKSPDLKLSYFSEEEQLLLLISALEKAILETLEIESEIQKMLSHEAAISDLKPELRFTSLLARPDKMLQFVPDSVEMRQQQANKLQDLLNSLQQNSLKDTVNLALVKGIRDQIQQTISPDLKTERQLSNLFQFYILNILIQAARNEGALVYYKDVLKRNPETLIFRARAGQIYDSNYPYTHAVIEFEKKPPLEIHLGVKVHGRLRMLYDCDVCVLYKMEAESCRENQREPRASRILIAIDCHHCATPLKIELAQAFLAFSSELRVAGNCYFVSNSESDAVAKLLASRKRKWESGIIPHQTNNVNRLMYEFQNTFKDFKAKS